MRTHLILAAFALAATPALAQQTAPTPAGPSTAGPTTTAPTTAAPAAQAAPATGITTQGASAAVPAEVAAQLTTGATVFDTQGGQVGTIEAINGTDIVVTTGAAKATIPAASFGKGSNGPVLSVTRAQLEAAVTGANTGPTGK